MQQFSLRGHLKQKVGIKNGFLPLNDAVDLSKLVIGLVRLESLKPGFVDSRFESLLSGSANPMKALACLFMLEI